MRPRLVHAFVILLALALAGCSIASNLAGRLPRSGPSSSPPTASNDAAFSAIQAVIQRANEEQQEAFSKHDPSIMKDTATADYYNEMVQINRDLAANGGVSAIELVKIEWGPITLRGPTIAEATTFETWRTSYVNGRTDESRERNVYTLVQEQGVWKIQSDEHPDARPAAPPPPGSLAAGPGMLPGRVT